MREELFEAFSKFVKPVKKSTSQEFVEGYAPLTPIQKYLFESSNKAINHFNQSVMLYKEDSFDEVIVRNIFNEIVAQHDALRFVYEEKNNEVIAYNRGLDSKLYTLHVYDLKNENHVETKIEQLANSIQSSIDLKNGPLVKLGLFKTIKGDQLLIAIHHLVVDGVSWRILLEDLISAYENILRNEPIKLPGKTTSFLEWSKELNKYANSNEMTMEREYWNEVSQFTTKTLYKDNIISEEENIMKNCRTVKISFSKEETYNLLRKVNIACNTEINDILLSALSMAMNEWTGEEKILISLEGHGREKISEEVNISRTVGWFTTRYPVLLEIKDLYDIGYAIKSTKENLRKVPNKGIGYGVLRYISSELEIKIEPEISFNYLGSFDQYANSELFILSNIFNGESVSPDSKNLFAIDINGMIIDQQLNVSFLFNDKEYYKDSIAKLGNMFKENLCKIIDYCLSKKEQGISQSVNENKNMEQVDNLKESLQDVFEGYNDDSALDILEEEFSI